MNERLEFLRHVHPDPDSSGCWKWAGPKCGPGYGQFTFNGLKRTAHRTAYELFVGPINAELCIDHVCHNRDLACPGGAQCLHRLCVNPAHLEVVTQTENKARGAQRKKACPQGHVYSEQNTRLTSSGHRRCRACHNERERLRRLSRKEQAA